MTLNPYIAGPKVSGSAFFGRKAELGWLENRLMNSIVPSSCAIQGETRIGKSSLLDEFSLRAQEKRAQLLVLNYDVGSDFRFADAGRADTAGFYRQLVGLIYQDIRHLPGIDHVAAQNALDPGTPWIDTMRAIRRVFKSARSEDRWLVVCLDEFDAITEQFKFDPQGWKILRTLGYDPAYRLCYVTASRRSLVKLEQDAGISSNFAGIFGSSNLRLGLMEPEEARELVVRPAEEVGMPWSPDEVDVILRIGGGHPYCLQEICRHAFEWRGTGKSIEDADDLQVVTWLLPQFRVFLDALRKRLESSGLFDVLLRVAHQVPSGALSEDVTELVDLGYLIPCEGPDTFEPFSPVLDYYLRARGRTKDLWPLMEMTEVGLRHLVEERYTQKYGSQWIDEVRRRNPGSTGAPNRPPMLGMVERWESARNRDLQNPFAVVDASASLIDFSYIQDLRRLIVQEWAQFQSVFPWTQFEFEAKMKVLENARNPSAHYRRISLEGVRTTADTCDAILKALAPTKVA